MTGPAGPVTVTCTEAGSIGSSKVTVSGLASGMLPAPFAGEVAVATGLRTSLPAVSAQTTSTQ